jgi:branched-subunit amino acid transport protein
VKLLALVLLMAAATFIPRVLPFYLFKDPAGGPPAGGSPGHTRHPGNHLRNSYARRLLKRSLSLIPYAALGALIFPGVFAGRVAFSYAAAAGASAAVATSLIGGGLVPSVIASVAASFAVLLLTGS